MVMSKGVEPHSVVSPLWEGGEWKFLVVLKWGWGNEMGGGFLKKGEMELEGGGMTLTQWATQKKTLSELLIHKFRVSSRPGKEATFEKIREILKKSRNFSKKNDKTGKVREIYFPEGKFTHFFQFSLTISEFLRIHWQIRPKFNFINKNVIKDHPLKFHLCKFMAYMSYLSL